MLEEEKADLGAGGAVKPHADYRAVDTSILAPVVTELGRIGGARLSRGWEGLLLEMETDYWRGREEIGAGTQGIAIDFAVAPNNKAHNGGDGKERE